MASRITDVPPRKAALVAGIAFIAMFVLAILVDNLILPNFIGPGDTTKLARDIEADGTRFGVVAAGYLIILMFDAAIALALYVILKPASKRLASLTAVLRLLYTAILIVGVLAFVFHWIDVYRYANIKLIGYIFFIAHILALGYSVLRSGYIPRGLGVLLIVAFFCYPVLFFGRSIVPEALLFIFMVPAAIAELSLGIWLLLKRAKLDFPRAIPDGP